MIAASTEFRKNGFNDQDAAQLGQIASMYQNVSDEAISAGESASFIISQLTAFGDSMTEFSTAGEKAQHVIDGVNEVANNFSVSSADLANNLGNMSAVMAQTGASFEESLGMLTAITEVTRNASKASRGLVSIGSRLNQVVDESSSTGAALKEIYESLNIELFDSEGQLRSSYEVFSDLAAIWDTLDKNTQNYIASQQAGTNQFQTFAALMQNFSTATEATTTAINSAGSAANENAAYMGGLEAKTSQVAASFEKLSNSVVNSQIIVTVLDSINAALTALNTPVGVVLTQFTLLTGVFIGAIGVFGPIIAKIVSMIKVLKDAGGVIKFVSSVFNAVKTSATTTAAALSGVSVGAQTTAKGFIALSAAAAPVAAALSGLVLLIEGVIALSDYLNISLEEQKEKVNSLSGELSSLQSEYDTLSSSQNLTEADEQRLKVLEAQIEANKILLEQEAQKQYIMRFGSSVSDPNNYSEDFWNRYGGMLTELYPATTTTTLQDIETLKDYQSQIQKIEEDIINLDDSSKDYAEQVQDLTKQKKELTEKYNELNGEVITTVSELITLTNQMSNVPPEAQEVIDAFTELYGTEESVSIETHRMITLLKAVNNVKIVPKDAKDMEDFISKLSDADFFNLQQMLEGLGDGAEQFVKYLNHMDSADVARLATQAVKNFTGAISEASDHMSEFEAALEKDYTEGLQDTVQVMDYIQQSQTNGIKNWEAYEAALSTFYGTADEQLIKTQESTAAINTAFNTAGTTMGNYQQYFEGNTFLADRFLQQLQTLATTSDETMQGLVSGQENSQGLWELQIEDVGRLAEVLGLTEPVLMGMFDYLGSVADINIAEPIDAAHAALIDLKEDMEGVASLEVDVSSADNAVAAAQGIKDSLESALGEGAVTVDIDTSNAQESLETLQGTAANVAKSLTDSGEWDFTTIAQEIKDNMGDLGEDVEIDVDTGAIQFNSEEAVTAFKEQLTNSFEGIDSEVIFANFFENTEVTASTAAQDAVDAFISEVNNQLSTTNMAWVNTVNSVLDQLGAEIEIPKDKIDQITEATGLAEEALNNLNGTSLSTVITTLNNTKNAADGLKTQFEKALSALTKLSNKNWTIKVSYTQSGSSPNTLLGFGASKHGHRGYASGKHADGAEYLRFNQNETSLTGEEGEELLIGADGSQRLVGANGPEFVQVKRGDTIIPANVTAMIKSGKIKAFGGGVTSTQVSMKSSPLTNPVINVESSYSGETILLNSNTSATYSNASAKSNLTANSKSATNASEELSDVIKEQSDLFDEQNDILEHQIFIREKQGASYSELIDLNRQYQKQLHEQAEWYRQQGLEDSSEQIRQLQKDWWGLEDTIVNLQHEAFDERLQLSEDYIDKRNTYNSWGADSEIKAWKRVLDWMDEWYKQGLIDYEYYLEQREEAYEKYYDAYKADLEREANVYETLFSTVARKAQEEIDDLQSYRDEREEYWNAQIDALQKTNDELDDQIEKEEALDALARARQSKVLVYKDGRFQYINDIDEVSEAQANLDKINREQQLQQELANLEELRDKELASIDEQIEGWEKYKEEWASVVEDYEEKQDELLILQELGIDLEGENWEKRLENLESYVKRYEDLMDRLANAQNVPEEIGGGNTGHDIVSDVIENIKDGMHDISNSLKGNSSSSSSGSGSGNRIEIADGIATGTGGGNPYGPNGTPSRRYASGTSFARQGLSLVGENGPELRLLNAGDGILPSDITKNLWSWGMMTPANMLSTILGHSTLSKDMVVSIENLNLPNVQDGPGFVDYMRNNFWRKTLQFQTS